MSYGRVSHPSEMVQIGQELEVKVLDIDWEARAHLARSETAPDLPLAETSPPNIPSARACRVRSVSITNYGAFVELEPGIEGLVHISEMSWTRNVRHPSKNSCRSANRSRRSCSRWTRPRRRSRSA